MKKAIKTAIITTVRHNVGDDFVREGIKHLLTSAFPDRQFHFQSIHKHAPISSTYGFEWLRDNRFARRIDRFLPVSLLPDRIREADLIIQSGAPVFWCLPSDHSYCSQNEWYQPLMVRRRGMNPSVPFINLAGGSCQPYFSAGEEFDRFPAEYEYIRKLTRESVLTTVRDPLAAQICAKAGVSALPVLPCTSIFAVDYHNIHPKPGEYVVFNYMEGGAHFTLGQKINSQEWRQTVLRLYGHLKTTIRVVFSCHNKKEIGEVRNLIPDAEIFFSEDYLEFMRFYSGASFGVMNRVHGAFLMASLGKPSLIIGNDSRARMAEMIGLKSWFINDATTDEMFRALEQLINGLQDYPAVIGGIKNESRKTYQNLLIQSLGNQI
ncbi:MAG: polysaccharide pyruvyl transferase family protein [Bacteroidetes bacterium]|nr:polysaccharide pyruvyl transferase family protein [Bacteroidota bacterium]